MEHSQPSKCDNCGSSNVEKRKKGHYCLACCTSSVDCESRLSSSGTINPVAGDFALKFHVKSDKLPSKLSVPQGFICDVVKDGKRTLRTPTDGPFNTKDSVGEAFGNITDTTLYFLSDNCSKRQVVLSNPRNKTKITFDLTIDFSPEIYRTSGYRDQNILTAESVSLKFLKPLMSYAMISVMAKKTRDDLAKNGEELIEELSKKVYKLIDDQLAEPFGCTINFITLLDENNNILISNATVEREHLEALASNDAIAENIVKSSEGKKRTISNEETLTSINQTSNYHKDLDAKKRGEHLESLKSTLEKKERRVVEHQLNDQENKHKIELHKDIALITDFEISEAQKTTSSTVMQASIISQGAADDNDYAQGLTNKREAEKLENVSRITYKNFEAANTLQSNSKKQTEEPVDNTIPKAPISIKPKEHEFIIEDGEVGYTYESIMLPYLTGATRVEINEPYIESPHQLHNFVRFCEVILKEVSIDKISLNTKFDYNSVANENENEKNRKNEKIRIGFQQLKNDLKQRDITLDITFDETLHHRQIEIDNGWNINLCRGLDIYHYNDGFFTIGANDFSYRKCKKTKVKIYEKKLATVNN